MADEYQIEKLKQGVKAWNEWRKANESEEINLRKAELADFDLMGAYLEGAKLEGANLEGAKLEGAKLE